MHAGSLSSETLEGLHSHYKCLKRLLKQSYLLTVQGVLKVLCSFPKRETFFFFCCLLIFTENRADSEVFQQRGGAVKALTPKTRPFCDRQVGEL